MTETAFSGSTVFGEPETYEYERRYTNGPVDVENDGRLVPASKPLSRNEDLRDQADDPYGWLVINRRDQHGWYVRWGVCSGNDFTKQRGECLGEGPEMGEDFMDDTVSYPCCLPCWSENSDER